MTRLAITKNTEARAVATIWSMAAESLDPESYEKLESALALMCATRNISSDIIEMEKKAIDPTNQ